MNKLGQLREKRPTSGYGYAALDLPPGTVNTGPGCISHSCWIRKNITVISSLDMVPVPNTSDSFLHYVVSISAMNEEAVEKSNALAEIDALPTNREELQAVLGVPLSRQPNQTEIDHALEAFRMDKNEIPHDGPYSRVFGQLVDKIKGH